MIPVYITCPDCLGKGYTFSFSGKVAWPVCALCRGTCRRWAPGAPAYGCEITLADREPGEVVTLGNGQRAKILWHMPRRRRGQVPETTFLDILVDFTEQETFVPVPYPSCVGVSSVDAARAVVDRDAHERETDAGDPLQRYRSDLLQHSVRAPDEPF